MAILFILALVGFCRTLFSLIIIYLYVMLFVSNVYVQKAGQAHPVLLELDRRGSVCDLGQRDFAPLVLGRAD